MQPAMNYSLMPKYNDYFCRSIGVLQQLQTLLSKTATLGDVAQLIHGFQQEFGVQEHLEDVIQHLVRSSLEEQIASRKISQEKQRNAGIRSDA